MNTPIIPITGSTESQRQIAKQLVKYAFDEAAERFGVVELARRICARDVEVMKQAA